MSKSYRSARMCPENKNVMSEGQTDDLPKRAQARLRRRAPRITELSEEEVCRVIGELQSHQLELETQNEELRRAQEELLGPGTRIRTPAMLLRRDRPRSAGRAGLGRRPLFRGRKGSLPRVRIGGPEEKGWHSLGWSSSSRRRIPGGPMKPRRYG